MFKVKRASTGEILQVLDVYFDPMYKFTYFLVWENDGWRWREARYYVPPNYEPLNKENQNK